MSDLEKIKSFVNMLIDYNKNMQNECEKTSTLFALREGCISGLESVKDAIEDIENGKL